MVLILPAIWNNLHNLAIRAGLFDSATTGSNARSGLSVQRQVAEPKGKPVVRFRRVEMDYHADSACPHAAWQMPNPVKLAL